MNPHNCSFRSNETIEELKEHIEQCPVSDKQVQNRSSTELPSPDTPYFLGESKDSVVDGDAFDRACSDTFSTLVQVKGNWHNAALKILLIICFCDLRKASGYGKYGGDSSGHDLQDTDCFIGGEAKVRHSLQGAESAKEWRGWDAILEILSPFLKHLLPL